MDSLSYRSSFVGLVLALSITACGDDSTTNITTSPGDTEPPDDDDSSSTDTLPPTTSSSSSSSSSSTDATESQSDTGTDTTEGSSSTTMEDDSTSSSSSGSSSESSSSSTGPDIDLECEGPAGDDTCDTPSPFDGVGDCDPYAQDCPEGEKCMPWANDGGNSWNATRCSPLDPAPAQLGDECLAEGSGVSGVDNCDIGLMCWGVDTETNIGTCIELCGCGPEEPTCAGGGTFCVISNENALPICLSTCDPLVADVCPAGEGCYPLDANFLCAPDASLDEGQQDDPCEYINVCDPGLACMFGVGDCGAAGCCAQFCDIDTGNADCSGLTECIPFFPEGTEPEECHVDTGVCLEP
jgi:hypothetical protein